MVTQINKAKTKKSIREDELGRAFDSLSSAFFAVKESEKVPEGYTIFSNEASENDFQIQRWQWEGGA